MSIIPNFADAIVGFYSALVVASLGLAVVFAPVWWSVSKEWLEIAVSIVRSPRELGRIFGRCQIDKADAPRRMAAAVFMIAGAMGGRATMTIVVILINPWTANVSTFSLIVIALLTLWAVAGYYVALSAWQTVLGRVPSRRFMLWWACSLIAVTAVMSLVAHQARILIE